MDYFYGKEWADGTETRMEEKDFLNYGAIASLTSLLHLSACGTLSLTTTLFMTAVIVVHPQCLNRLSSLCDMWCKCLIQNHASVLPYLCALFSCDSGMFYIRNKTSLIKNYTGNPVWTNTLLSYIFLYTSSINFFFFFYIEIIQNAMHPVYV